MKVFNCSLAVLLLASSPALGQEAAPESKFRLMPQLFFGGLSPKGRKAGNAIESDYKSGGSAGLGLLGEFRPTPTLGIASGLKFLFISLPTETNNLHLGMVYLALPLEANVQLATLFQKSRFFLKVGLSYLILLSASVEESSGDESIFDDDDWDLFPSPPTQGDFDGSFNKAVVLASIGLGADFHLVDAPGGFNLSIIPEIVYNRSLRSIAKEGEFSSGVDLRGYLISLSLAAGF